MCFNVFSHQQMIFPLPRELLEHVVYEMWFRDEFAGITFRIDFNTLIRSD